MTKRRGHGEGSLYQRGNGRWTATIVVGRNSAGKRIRRNVYGKTKHEVQEKLLGLQSQKLEGTLAEVSRMTLGAWMDRRLS